MKERQVDVAVIGAGTAGIAAYRAARAAGANVVLVEGGESGTTCARVGCMPSKLLIAAADAARAVSEASAFGIHVNGGQQVDGRAVMARVRRERDRFVALVARDMLSVPEADRLQGQARFLDDRRLAIGAHAVLTAKSIVIASGSRPAGLEAWPDLGECRITSDDVFGWEDLPQAVAVVGPGVVGLEIGQALHRLGVRVAVFGQGGCVGPLGDPEILDYATRSFGAEFTLEADGGILSMTREGSRVVIRRTGEDVAVQTGHFDYVLVATGRIPDVAQLGLDKTTLKCDAKGVPLSDPGTTCTVSRTGQSQIFVAGDASNFLPLLHEAADEGRIAGTNAARLAAGLPVVSLPRRAPLAVVFTDPQIGIVGGGWHALKPGSFLTGQASFEDQGRARIMLRNQGLMNVYADRVTGRLLGAEIFAPAAEHLAHLLAWALQLNLNVTQMLEMPFYHPVLEEGLRSALQDLATQLTTVQPKVRAA